MSKRSRRSIQNYYVSKIRHFQEVANMFLRVDKKYWYQAHRITRSVHVGKAIKQLTYKRGLMTFVSFYTNSIIEMGAMHSIQRPK